MHGHINIKSIQYCNNEQVHLKEKYMQFFSHSYRDPSNYQSFIYSPTHALVSCLKKNNVKIYIKIYINFNVNFNILFSRQLTSAPVGE